MADEPTDATAGADDQAGWAAPGQQSREPAAGGPASSAATPPAAQGAQPPASSQGPPPGWTPAPTPQAAAGAPTQRRRGKTWLVVMISVLVVIIGTAAGGTILFVDRSYPPYDAASDFIERIDRGSFDAAFGQLCTADKDDLGTSENLRGLFRNVLDGSRGLTANALSVDRDGARAIVDFNVDYGGNDDKSYELHMREENGDWKPCPGDELRD